jgi:hypothetical protein
LTSTDSKKVEEQKFNVEEMKILCWMLGVTRKGKIKNEGFREKVNEIVSKTQESRLRWFGHLKIRNGEAHIGIEVKDMIVEGTRKKGRPRTR